MLKKWLQFAVHRDFMIKGSGILWFHVSVEVKGAGAKAGLL